MLLLALLAGSRSPGGVCEASCFSAGSLHLHPSQREQLQSEDRLENALFSSCFASKAAKTNILAKYFPFFLVNVYFFLIS
jgi:hypothetical protein